MDSFMRTAPSEMSLINLELKAALKCLHKCAAFHQTTRATLIRKAQTLYPCLRNEGLRMVKEELCF